MPHLHLSLQAASDLILKRMKRRHLRADAAAAIERARALRPGIAIGADLIAGFPTETEALFAETLQFRHRGRAAVPARVPLQRAPRHAGRADARRAARGCGANGLRGCARQAGDAAQRFLAAQLGQTVSLLTETADGGHSEHFAPVRLAAPVEPGRLLPVRVVGVTGDALLAEAA